MNTQYLESGLRKSIDHYSRIFHFLSTLEEQINTASHQVLQEMNALLTEMQAQATETDQMVMDHSTEYSMDSDIVRVLMAEREKLINKVLLLNRNITVKAMGVKSLLAHEIGTLRNGHKALGGYKPNMNGQGRLINTSL